MHVPINIPSLAISTQRAVDMNNELTAHGVSNLLSGFLGGLQNYLCYSNSLLYFKCNGQGKTSGYLLALLTCVFFYYGPSIVYYIPRCMAGCLLLHVGVDLTKEGIWDSRIGLDDFEYASVLTIALVMTFYGLTAGLVLGVVCAAMTFTLQISSHVPPIRGMMRARTLRSSRWRSEEAAAIVDKYSRHILVVQLQGQLFFANATSFASEVETILSQAQDDHDIWYLILDFTLVLAIDSSAVETITGIFQVCKKYNVKLCYSRSSRQGFPCAVDLSRKLIELAEISSKVGSSSINKSASGRLQKSDETQRVLVQRQIHVADSLDEALGWCENALIATFSRIEIVDGQPSYLSPDIARSPKHLRQLYTVRPPDVSRASIDMLLSYFKSRSIRSGEVLWRQGEESKSAVLLVSGSLLNSLEEEAGTTEVRRQHPRIFHS